MNKFFLKSRLLIFWFVIFSFLFVDIFVFKVQADLNDGQLKWVYRAPMPTPRSWADSVGYNGKIYVVGGCSCLSNCRQFYNAVTTLEVYDPYNDTWDILPPMFTPRVGAAVAAINGKIYVIGGFNRKTWSANATVEVYDINNKSWSVGKSMPTPRSWARAVVLNGQIYVLGGVGYRYYNICEKYNPVTDTWSSCAPFNGERYLHAAVTANGRIYVIGGDSWEGGYSKVYSDIQEYNPLTNSWTSKKPMPTANNDLDAVAENNKIWVFGYNISRVYDIATDQWEEMTSNHTPVGAFSVEYLNGMIYRFGGGGWGPTLNIVEAVRINHIDSDFDGLPDEWEMRYFGNLNQGPNDDPDGDGFTNFQEYNNGTIPTPGMVEVYVKDTGCIYKDESGNPDHTKPLKCLPDGWILKRTIENNKFVEKDIGGVIWWKVVDVTDEVSGWMKKSELNYDPNMQIEWKRITEKLNPLSNPVVDDDNDGSFDEDPNDGIDNDRDGKIDEDPFGTVPTILEAVEHYYTNKEGIPIEFTFQKELKNGMKDKDVKYLQMVLKKEGFFPNDEICIENFGPITEDAVKDFQDNYGLTVNGIVDQDTRNKLNQFLQQGKYNDLIIRSPLFYISNDKDNYLSIFRDVNFPMELILGIASQETGPYVNWNNEFISYDCGRGIMQITYNEYVGKGTGIKCFSDKGSECLRYRYVLDEKLSGCYGSCCYDNNLKICSDCSHCRIDELGNNADDCGQEYCKNKNKGWRCTCRFNINCKCNPYTNTMQGVYSNIKDGLRALQESFDHTKVNYQNTCCKDGLCDENKKLYCCKDKKCEKYEKDKCDEILSTLITCRDMREMSTVQRYNIGTGGNKKFNKYIAGIANHLKRLGDNDYFGTLGQPYVNLELAEKLIYASNNNLTVKLMSPGNISVYDSEGRITGIINGEIKEEIPSSIYDEINKTIFILFPTDFYHYRVKGEEKGKYGLIIENIEGGKEISFKATDIPISTGVIHQYQIDWQKLSHGEKGVTLQIDADGDGIFEKTITSDSELTQEEFKKATAIRGDLDLDGDVDQDDLNILFKYRNQPASACPACDLDGDGMITVLDARKLVLLCTRPKCATQ